MVNSTVANPVTPVRRRGFFGRLRRNPAGIIGLILIILLAFASIAGPYFYTQSPQRNNALAIMQEPSAEHWLGTDELGRDVLARILAGGRISLSVGVLSMLIGLFVGTAAGALAGYFGGFIETIVMRLVDVFMAIPNFFLILAIVTAFGSSPTVVILTVALGFWSQMARVVHAEFNKYRHREFVEASQALGARDPRVIIRHILPQVLPQMIVLGTLGIGWAILTEASLSYLGLGIQPPLASWGNMLQNAQAYLWSKPILAIWPGLFIALTVLAFNMFGNALRDLLDPRN